MKYLPNLFTRLVLILLIGFLWAGCTGRSGQRETDPVSKPAQLNEAVRHNLGRLMEQAIEDKGQLDDSVFLQGWTHLQSFYEQRDHARLWSEASEWLPAADTMMKLLDRCEQYGLFRNAYLYPQLKQIRNRMAVDTLVAGDRLDAMLWARAELLLTNAFFSVAADIYAGRMKSDSIYKRRDTVAATSLYIAALDRVLKGHPVDTVLQTLEPVHNGYHQLKFALRKFLPAARLDREFTYLVYPYKDSLAFVASLVKRLQEEAVLPAQLQRIDSVTLRQAIVTVQHQRGLKADGRFGIQLVTALNDNDPETFRRIAINLDRYKMIPQQLPERFIWVNLPAFHLQLVESDTIRLQSKVIIGKPKTRTPLLNSNISNIVTYPQWTIPTSIIVKEILPALKKNPGYLARKGYSLVTWDGEAVDPYAVDWSKYTKGIPYKVVQGSGDDNALGVLKFNFPNKYDVYLHDTNQRYLFKNASRALSHGCVRVQEWQQLSLYMAALDSIQSDTALVKRYTPTDSIKAWLKRKEKHIIPVRARLPVYFRYFTAEGHEGKLRMHPDVYGDDRAVRSFYSIKID